MLSVHKKVVILWTDAFCFGQIYSFDGENGAAKVGVVNPNQSDGNVARLFYFV